jgi:hypothetical protein
MCLFKMRMNCSPHETLKKSYVRECYICQFLPSLDNLQTYLIKHTHENLLGTKNKHNYFKEILEDHPYLDLGYTQPK